MSEVNVCFAFFFLVCKEPPYKVEESGYAGFIMPIEVHFKNKVESCSANCFDCFELHETVEPLGKKAPNYVTILYVFLLL